jgi:hypothetical protein
VPRIAAELKALIRKVTGGDFGVVLPDAADIERERFGEAHVDLNAKDDKEPVARRCFRQQAASCRAPESPVCTTGRLPDPPVYTCRGKNAEIGKTVRPELALC